MITGIQGVDYAWPPHPSPSALVAAGKHFVVRYGGPGTEGKWIHVDEARALSDAGLTIVANAEGSADGLGNGFNVGVSWARSADKWFRNLGMPNDRPIYFSVDFNVTADDWDATADGLRGAASVIGPARVGVYGHYNCMRWAARDRVARWFWQTYAWSAGRWSPDNHIEQYHNGVYLDGVQLDLNRAIDGDFGQWTLRSQTMLIIKTSTDTATYISDTKTYRHIQDPKTLKALVAAGHRIVEVENMAQLEDAAGTLQSAGTGTISGTFTGTVS